MQAFDVRLGAQRAESERESKKALSKDSALAETRAYEYARGAAVPYVEAGARIRGSDGAYAQHSALPELVELQEPQVNPFRAAER